MRGIIRTHEEIRARGRELIDGQNELRSDWGVLALVPMFHHVMHADPRKRDFRMHVGAQPLNPRQTHCPIRQRCPFEAVGENSKMLHAALLPSTSESASSNSS